MYYKAKFVFCISMLGVFVVFLHALIADEYCLFYADGYVPWVCLIGRAELSGRSKCDWSRHVT